MGKWETSREGQSGQPVGAAPRGAHGRAGTEGETLGAPGGRNREGLRFGGPHVPSIQLFEPRATKKLASGTLKSLPLVPVTTGGTLRAKTHCGKDEQGWPPPDLSQVPQRVPQEVPPRVPSVPGWPHSAHWWLAGRGAQGAASSGMGPPAPAAPGEGSWHIGCWFLLALGIPEWEGRGGRRERGRPCVHSQLKLCQHPAPRGIPPLRRSRQSCAGRWSSNALAPKSLLGGVAGCGLFFCLAIMLSRP